MQIIGVWGEITIYSVIVREMDPPLLAHDGISVVKKQVV